MPPQDEATRRLAEVAHELNNPLAAILAFAQDLLQADPTPEQREALLVIQQQARRSRLLVRGLLESVRADVPRSEAVDPRDLLGRVAIVFDRICRERGLALEWSAPDQVPLIEGDAAGLEQVLTNLLQNACDASPSGGLVSLSCRLRGRLLEFTVRDRGPGVAAEHLGQIFDPYFTTKEPGAGTGLGLSIAQGIVRRHRGALVAENVPAAEGGGARFVVAIPFLDRRREDRDTGPEPGAGTDIRGTGRVLLIEDDADLRLALRRYLERAGWSVAEAGDGETGLGMLVRGGIDAVLCDVHIPGMPGTEVYDRIRATAPALAARFILTTGDAPDEDLRAFQRRTGAAVLRKPFELRALAERLGQGGP